MAEFAVNEEPNEPKPNPVPVDALDLAASAKLDDVALNPKEGVVLVVEAAGELVELDVERPNPNNGAEEEVELELADDDKDDDDDVVAVSVLVVAFDVLSSLLFVFVVSGFVPKFGIPPENENPPVVDASGVAGGGIVVIVGLGSSGAAEADGTEVFDSDAVLLNESAAAGSFIAAGG